MTRPRKPDRDLTDLLHRTSAPIAVYDDQRRVIYANRALGDWLGVEATTLLGQKCEYHSHSPAEGEMPLIQNQICPPPQAFHGESLEAEFVAVREGVHRRRRVQFIPLGHSPLDCVGVFALFAEEDEAEEAKQGLDSEATPDELHLAVSARLGEFRVSLAADALIGQSLLMRHVAQQVALAQENKGRVVIAGPEGAGREHVARSIHYGRARGALPLTPLPCPLLDKELLESTLLRMIRQGSEPASDGPPTLLLLDVDQLPSDAQADLAHLLSNPDLHFSTISTAARSLISLSEEGKYNAKLAYALSPLIIEIPPLASRREDIPLLAQHFLEAANIGSSKQLGGISERGMEKLVEYAWPGHVEQLREIIYAAHRKADGPLIDLDSLPREILHYLEAAREPEEEEINLVDFLAKMEAEVIRRALNKTKGNKAAAARMLGISRPRLLRRIALLLPEET